MRQTRLTDGIPLGDTFSGFVHSPFLSVGWEGDRLWDGEETEGFHHVSGGKVRGLRFAGVHLNVNGSVE